MIVIDSTPQGADVIGPDKKSVGKTPVHLTLSVSDAPQTFELKLSGYKKKTKQIVVTGNAVIPITLERAPAVQSTHKDNTKKGSGDNALMRPDDL